MQTKYYSLRGLRNSLFTIGWGVLIAAALIMAVRPLAVDVQQQGSINTHRYEALEATTPGDFVIALRQLDQSLQDAGMAQGNAVARFMGGGTHTDMAFKRATYAGLADRADGLTALSTTSVEVNTALSEMKTSLLRTPTNSVSFWVFQQGGWVTIFVIPLGLVLLAIVIFIVASALPYSITRRVNVDGATT